MFDLKKRNEIFETVLKNNGGSYTFDGVPVSHTSGYAVSIVGFETIVPVEGMSPFNFISLVNDTLAKVDGLADPINHMLGIWINDGNLHIDLSVHIQDKDTAITKAIAGSQLAIWDFELALWDFEAVQGIAVKQPAVS